MRSCYWIWFILSRFRRFWSLFRWCKWGRECASLSFYEVLKYSVGFVCYGDHGFMKVGAVCQRIKSKLRLFEERKSLWRWTSSSECAISVVICLWVVANAPIFGHHCLHTAGVCCRWWCVAGVLVTGTISAVCSCLDNIGEADVSWFGGASLPLVWLWPVSLTTWIGMGCTRCSLLLHCRRRCIWESGEDGCCPRAISASGALRCSV